MKTEKKNRKEDESHLQFLYPEITDNPLVNFPWCNQFFREVYMRSHRSYNWVFLWLYFSLVGFIFGSFSKPSSIVSVKPILTLRILFPWSLLLYNPFHTDLSPIATWMEFLHSSFVRLWGICWWAAARMICAKLCVPWDMKAFFGG